MTSQYKKNYKIVNSKFTKIARGNVKFAIPPTHKYEIIDDDDWEMVDFINPHNRVYTICVCVHIPSRMMKI